MEISGRRLERRRKFLQMLAASPLFALPQLHGRMLGHLFEPNHAGLEKMLDLLKAPASDDGQIASVDQALDVMDFEPVARKTLPPAHWGYLATGVDDDATIRANREGYSKIQLRSRRLIDTQNLDTSVTLFGATWKTPIVICPVGSQKAFHPEGEIAVAKAARAKGHLQILSTVSSVPVEEVIAARGGPVWQQLYPTNVWEVARGVAKRAEAAGCPALALTVDLQNNSNRETLFRARRADTRQCSTCHGEGMFADVRHRPMFQGLDVSKVTGVYSSSLTWDFVKRLKDSISMKLLIKGIVTREDAQLAVENGVDGIMVSNHGGRGEETLRGTIESLPEVVDGAAGRIPVIVDGGVRRGTDIFKALALGANAVGIGRPYIWGLASFGQEGVEAVLTILQRELETIMRQAGTPSLAKVTRACLVDHKP